MNKEDIIQELGLKPFGTKGWMNSPTLICPECGRSDKTGVIFSDKGAKFNCMRCSIGMYINKFFKLTGRHHLIEINEHTASIEHKIKSLYIEEEIEEDVDLPEKRLPVGCREVVNDEYLESRNFSEYHYRLFKPVQTKIDLSKSNMIIFQIFDDRDRRVAWLSRSKRDKLWHKENERKHKEEGERLVLRYDNSPDTDFSSILGGINDMTDEITSVILVEGLFDKVNVDNKLDLPTSDDMICLFTFGDSIKRGQINILKKYPNIENIFLMYDYNTIINSKRYGLELNNELKSVDIYVCEIDIKDADPGILSKNSILDILNKSVNVIEFNKKKLNRRLC